ncbi:ras GEF [Coniochaeta ligniaria NRRL 30616]|uniref:Ras GEF n=1 Tax=Coniochaeta ligniaria NRRL 30616 TaxID=1408157 RepID=A0A1J7IKG8_9PEZI|nr:ras GEF [Coniochaeta ligniaria NRRL 30616]
MTSSGMLNDEPMRESLQVAPLTIQKAQSGDHGADTMSSANMYSQSDITPPVTPNGSQEDLNTPPNDTKMFHSFLRAFYPFSPTYAMTDSTVTLPLNEGDVVLVHSIHTNGWADGTLLASGARGWLPTNYCEPYDPDELRNLLKALLNFWDLLRSAGINDSEVFGNQEFMKGIIAGVRYLLERADCLTRESPLVQSNDRLRRGRKSLLSELSSLVKTAKRLLEMQKLAETADDVNDIIDEMILKAFKIVTKGVRFLDILESDRRERASSVAAMDTRFEETHIPPTPPADATTFGDKDSQGKAKDADTRADGSGADAELRVPQTSASGPTTVIANKRVSSLYPPASASSNRLSHSNQVQTSSLSSTVSHRVSLVGTSNHHASPQNFVSERLLSCHDIFLTYSASLIGRLHLQSQSRPHLALAIKQSASSGGDLLVVVDVVCAKNALGSEFLHQSRTAMCDGIRNLVYTARDIINNPSGEFDDVVMPQDSSRLLAAATDCVIATGDCVHKTKLIIERIGDSEFEADNGSLGIDLDLGCLDVVQYESERRPSTATSDPSSVTESSVSEAATTTSTAVSVVSTAPSRLLTLSVDKPLPDVPQVMSPLGETQITSTPPTSRPQSLTEDAPAIARSSVTSVRPELPPLPKISTSLLSEEEYSPTEHSAEHEGEFQPSFRIESMTASSTGSNNTSLSRVSESSFVSQTSTRATTPDISSGPKNQLSLSELSTTESSTLTEEVDEVESKLLEKTFAHELIFNKEGQVTGGSLAALVERLTSHESTPDAMFVSTFYLTFRLFSTPKMLAESLIDRFDYVGEAPHMASAVRLRVYNAFKGWLESHWRDELDREALPKIQQFAEFKLSTVLPSAGKRLLELSLRVMSMDGTLVPRLVSSMGKTSTSISLYIPADTPIPASILTKSQTNLLNNWRAGGTCPTVLDFDPLEIARQLTIKQMTVFCSIMPEELLGSQWMKKGGVNAPNVKAMSSFSTELSNLVADTILQYSEVKKRASVIKQWIKIAHQCLELHNYDALMAIICSLNSSTITRLRRTWDIISPKRRQMLKHLQGIVEPSQNNKILRARLHDHVPPCLPFLGMFLTDLTFVDIGNPATKTSDNGMTLINFDKHTRTAKIIGELQRFQIPYRLTEVPDLQEWLQYQIIRVRELEMQQGNSVQVSYYRKSLLLEPRETQTLRTPVETPAGVNGPNGMFSWMRANSSSTSNPLAVAAQT